MNIDAFFAQHGLESNPFCAEEARQDRVFERIEQACRHPEFEKIIGDLDRPSSSVVFGERGRVRLRCACRSRTRSREPMSKARATRSLVLAYDEFNAVLSNLCDSTGMLDPADSVSSITLSDHLDAVLMLAVSSLVDAAMGGKSPTTGPFAGIPDIRKKLRGSALAVRRDLQVLQVCYDQAEDGRRRAEKIRKSMQLGSRSHPTTYRTLAIACAVVAGGWAVAVGLGAVREGWLAWLPSILLLLGAIISGSWWLRLRFTYGRLARRLSKAIRVSDRDQLAFSEVVASMSRARLAEAQWPGVGVEEVRFRMLARLENILRAIDVHGVFVLVDRVDEPVAITR